MALTRGDKNLADAPYNLTHALGQETLQSYWVGNQGHTVAYVKANIVPELFARYNGLGWTDNQVMAMTLLPAYWNDWVIKGNGGGQPITGVITSNNGVEVPAGVYLVNYPCIMDGGEYVGQGTGFSGTVGGTVSMHTNLVYDQAGWIGGLGGAHLDGQYTNGAVTTNVIFDQANLLQTTTWQVLSGGRSYTESGYCGGFRLTGTNSSWYDSAQRRCNGIGAWDLGETWLVEDIFAESFNGSGAVFVRGTPATINCLSAFVNAWSGVELIGSELNTFNFNTLSGDDNPALIGMSAGYGRGAGGVLNVNLGKSESGKRTPNKAQILIWQRDPCYGLININDAQCDMNNLFLDSMIVLKSNSASGGQVVHAQIRGWNCRTLLHDVTPQLRWPAQSYRPERITYSWRAGVATLFDETTGQVLPSSSVNAPDRLGWVANNGTFNYVTGTPAYDIFGGGVPPPPPPSCSWVTGPWSAFGPCIAGVQTQTRTVTSDTPGCTPSDPMPADTNTQPCSTPPPPVLPLFTRSPCNNNSFSTSIDIPNTTFKRIVLTGVTFTEASFNYQRLLVEAGANPKGIRIVPQSGGSGRFTLNTGAYPVQTPATIMPNIFYSTVEITFATPITADRLFGLPGTGSALRMTCASLDLYAN